VLELPSIIGSHILLYSKDPTADREFFRDILGFRSVDLGLGWLIFALPPAELGVHPKEEENSRKDHPKRELQGAEIHFMCDDLHALVKILKSKNVEFSPVRKANWGVSTTFKLPSGIIIGLYQPSHRTTIDFKAGRDASSIW